MERNEGAAARGTIVVARRCLCVSTKKPRKPTSVPLFTERKKKKKGTKKRGWPELEEQRNFERG